jgi:transketolase
MEGISQEAIALAGHLNLNRLIVLFDDNGISIDGPLSLADSVDQVKRFEAAGWAATRIDGHDPDAILAALTAAKASEKPTLIACRTVIGFGAPTKAGKSSSHGSPLGTEEIAGARDRLGWEHPPFVIPSGILDAWRLAGLRSKAAHKTWSDRLAKAETGLRCEFERRMRGDLPAGCLEATLKAIKDKLADAPQEVASRKASEMALEAFTAAIPEMLGGSADLTGSNNTRTKAMKVVTADAPNGRFIHWGVREHAMASAMNGIALHGGFIPFSGTFLVFSDYCRPAIRLAALMEQRVIHVMTHDSIGVGEDGPTHQPVEHLAALRAMPNVHVFRPADVVETAECWQIALDSRRTPSVLALTRQNLPQLRLERDDRNLSARGAYEIRGTGSAPAQVSLFASGSEVVIAVEARKLLASRGILARVVSVPCFDLFFRQDADYRRSVIGQAKVRIGVEAAVRMGWDALIGVDGHFVGMNGYGASGPYQQVYARFGITPEAIADAASRLLANG